MTTHNEMLSKEIQRLLGNRTQKWLSEKTGIAQSSISKILRGQQTPEPRSLELMARALEVDPRHLLALAGIAVVKPLHHPTAEYIAQRLDAIPDPLRELAIEAVGAVVDQFAAAATLLPRENPGDPPLQPVPSPQVPQPIIQAPRETPSAQGPVFQHANERQATAREVARFEQATLLALTTEELVALRDTLQQILDTKTG